MSNYFVSLILSLSSTDIEELLIFSNSNNKITIKIDLCFNVIVNLLLRQGVSGFLAGIKTMLEIVLENLVKLYGCCVEGNHRILVYNYLDNNSLPQSLLF
jgi:hypothetical protein